MHSWTGVVLAMSVVALQGCDRIESWRTGGGAESGQLVLSLQAPEALDWGTAGTLRLTLQNNADSVAPGAQIELYLPTWMEFASVEPAGTEVTLTSGTDQTRLSYRLTDALQPGEQRAVVQHVRVPDPRAPATGASAVPDTTRPVSPMGTAPPPPANRTVRARLVDALGETLGAEVQAVVAFRGATDAPPARVDSLPVAAGQTLVEGNRIGPVRLGMSANEIRQQVPDARDTTVAGPAAGSRQPALIVNLTQGRRVIAVLSGSVAEKLVVRDPTITTEQGLGVSSRVSQLRDAYGRGCSVVLDGGLSGLTFEGAPLTTFVVRSPTRTGAVGSTGDVTAVADTALVTELWIQEQAARC
jgi:hypothetical protein